MSDIDGDEGRAVSWSVGKNMDELARDAIGVDSSESAAARLAHCRSNASHSGRAAMLRTRSNASL